MLLSIVVCRRQHFCVSKFLIIWGVLQMGINFQNFEKKKVPGIFFCVPENVKNRLFGVLGPWANCQAPHVGHSSPKIKIIYEPVIMVLEGLKYKMLAYKTITCARDSNQ